MICILSTIIRLQDTRVDWVGDNIPHLKKYHVKFSDNPCFAPDTRAVQIGMKAGEKKKLLQETNSWNYRLHWEVVASSYEDIIVWINRKKNLSPLWFNLHYLLDFLLASFNSYEISHLENATYQPPPKYIMSPTWSSFHPLPTNFEVCPWWRMSEKLT